MNRKKWTPKSNVDDALIQFRLKRKWQIALRRYVFERNKSLSYAPYFGLDNNKFREWIEVQFDEELSWENFSHLWQLDHIVPVAYFDFSNNDDMRLCWNFTNIRVEKVESNKKRESRIDVMSAKKYFEVLFQQTGYSVCSSMVKKIVRIEDSQIAGNKAIADFLFQQKSYLAAVQHFSAEDFERLNTGTDLKTLIHEKEFLKKYGG
jgi:hypothetical protein